MSTMRVNAAELSDLEKPNPSYLPCLQAWGEEHQTHQYGQTKLLTKYGF